MGNNDVNKKSTLIKAAMFGSLAGAVMGLLLAPKSGQEMRQDLVEQAHAIGDKAVDIKGKAQSVWQNVEEKTQLTVNNGKSWINKGNQLVSNLKTLVSEIQQGALTKTVPVYAVEEFVSDKDSDSNSDIYCEIDATSGTGADIETETETDTNNDSDDPEKIF
ncbi:YtxH domain-containing protein [Desulfosporosinus shakirovi]|uniref:YtxH domain-containing protein n=1 Tax=Desulfosporosinus shakirovi TaxID=2885154 RepID=UPI001E565012|nr:YtxH domain-containing protein [Desulfosporosinus sp. SRJS8]MCB8814508.1 YtxH domain-containing protein [Desulfosporosinus sp. SRJS8]